jgi:CCR4-NOT complex subunit CAF16
VTYLGTEWAGNPIVRRDVPVSRLLKSLNAEKYPDRCAELLEIMDVNPNWHMHQVSDGERRRVQIVLGLMEPWEILLLDEVTVDLDVVVRANLLNFLKKETETRKATILYATHIFDGLAGFPTHVVHMVNGTVDVVREISKNFYELEEEVTKYQSNKDYGVHDSPLLRVVERWLRQDYKNRISLEPLEMIDGRPKTKWDILSENTLAHLKWVLQFRR